MPRKPLEQIGPDRFGLNNAKLCIAEKNTCPQPRIKGMRVCQFHGGKSLKGAASGTFKHGRYSKYLPKGLADKTQELLRDPQITSLMNELAVTQARFAEIQEKLKRGEAADLWVKLVKQYRLYRKVSQQQFRELQNAILKNDSETIDKALDTLRETILNTSTLDKLMEGGESEALAWREAYQVLTVIRKLSESERRREIELKTMLTQDEGLTLIVHLCEILKGAVSKYVTSVEIQRAIMDYTARNVRGLLGDGSLQSAKPVANL